MYPRKGFTLIELLVVIAILAVLAVVVVLTLNPAGLLQEARDTNRLSDMATLQGAINTYAADVPSPALGTSTFLYISVPDPSATSSAGDQCQGLNLPTAPSGTTYQCAQAATYKKTDGTGWIPINFSKQSFGTSLAQLPVDPIDQTSTGLYYTYATNGTQFEVTALFEASKNKLQYANNPIDPDYPEVDALGSNLTLSPLYNPSGLVGWWPLTEGVGTTTFDKSGNGANGSWNGNASGTTGYYSAGKVGSYAGYFDGSTDYVDVSNQTPFSVGTGNFSLVVWVDPNVLGANRMVIKKGDYDVGGYVFWIDSTGNLNLSSYDGTVGNLSTVGASVPLNTWSQIAVSVNRTGSSTMTINGVSQTVSGSVEPGSLTYASDVQIGHSSPAISNFSGLIGEARIYNRALSLSEIQALYNAER